MAAVLGPKYGNGGGSIVCDIDTNVQTNPHTIKPIVRVTINMAAYNALAAAGKTDIDAVTIADVIAQAFT